MLRAALLFTVQLVLWILVILLTRWFVVWNTPAFVERLRRIAALGRSRQGKRHVAQN